MKGGMLQGDERRRGATETEGGVHSSGILLGWSIFAARSVSTIDVNTVSDPASVSATTPSSPVPTVLLTGTNPQWKRYGGQHLETHKWIFLYKKKKER